MSQPYHNVFAQLQAFEKQIESLEARILMLEQKLTEKIQVERNHLIRIKNREELSDDFIQNGRKYQDLSPDKAWKLYNDKDFDFTLIDVSSKDYQSLVHIPEALHMPWEEFHERFLELQNKTTPLLIISEDGTKSVLACEFLIKRGYYNCNNISGGYKFWKGARLEVTKEKSA